MRRGTEQSGPLCVFACSYCSRKRGLDGLTHSQDTQVDFRDPSLRPEEATLPICPVPGPPDKLWDFWLAFGPATRLTGNAATQWATRQQRLFRFIFISVAVAKSALLIQSMSQLVSGEAENRDFSLAFCNSVRTGFLDAECKCSGLSLVQGHRRARPRKWQAACCGYAPRVPVFATPGGPIS